MAKQKQEPFFNEDDMALFLSMLRNSIAGDPYLNGNLRNKQQKPSAKLKPKKSVKPEILTIKVQIDKITKPPVWRRIKISTMWTFHNLHNIIQDAFGWTDSHLSMFGKEAYGQGPNISGNVAEEQEDCINGRKTLIGQMLGKVGDKLKYVYDYGDDWIHTITVEAAEPGVLEHPELLAGKGLCPPEDCGGPWGWEDLRELMKEDKLTEEEKERLEWYDLISGPGEDPIDVKDFDIEFARELMANHPTNINYGDI